MSIMTQHRSGLHHTSRRVSLGQIFALYRERRALARLDDTALADIGLTREEADAEASRPIWDIFAR